MKIVNILGGLGNQMFQYAFAVALQQKFPDERVLIDPSGFKGYPLHNGYELKRIFNATIPEATVKEQMSVFYPLRNYRMWQIGTRILPRRKTVIRESEDMDYDANILRADKSAYYLGYWQTEKYFKDIREQIIDAFKFPELPSDSPNIEVIDKISSKNAVSLHVRRGDYVKIGNTQGICTLDYYKKALKLMTEKTAPTIFVVFSDDIKWCRDNIQDLLGGVPAIYVDWNKGEDSFRDIQFMSMCKHNIIANSSFSWWGAWLNQNPKKVVIAPSRWMNGPGWSDIIPENWHTVKV